MKNPAKLARGGRVKLNGAVGRSPENKERIVTSTLVLVAGVVVLGSAALLIAGGEPPKDAKAPGEVKAGESEGTVYETPDGAKLAVVKHSEYKIVMTMDDLKLGEGKEATPGCTVKVKYHGTFKDGRVFDSTRGKEPVEYPLNNFIEGWKLGIPGMKVGGIRRLGVPHQLAYGQRGNGPVPPNTDIYFSIELLDVK